MSEGTNLPSFIKVSNSYFNGPGLVNSALSKSPVERCVN